MNEDLFYVINIQKLQRNDEMDEKKCGSSFTRDGHLSPRRKKKIIIIRKESSV